MFSSILKHPNKFYLTQSIYLNIWTLFTTLYYTITLLHYLYNIYFFSSFVQVTRPELYELSQIREEDVVVRQKICEMLVVLTRTHHGRELMRNRKVYPIVREMHEDTTKKVNRLLRSRGVTVDENSDEASTFDEVIFKLVDHLAAEEKVTEKGKEDEVEEEDSDEEEAGIVIGREDVTKGSGREYEVGFGYDPSKNMKNKNSNDNEEEEESEDSDDDDIFNRRMQNAADSDDDDDDDDDSNNDNDDDGNNDDDEEKEKAVFSMKTLTMEEREEKAYQEKENGNLKYKSSQYQEAIMYYRSARKYLPPPRLHAVCWSNESAAHGGLGNWKRASECAKECISIDPHYTKGYVRHSKALER